MKSKPSLTAAPIALFAACLALFAPTPAAEAEPPTQQAELRPFVLRWDDVEPSVIDLSFLSPNEAGTNGPVHVNADGYLATGEERLKLFGNNISAETVFADDVTDKMRDQFAGRLRKFGFNAMRLHHLGASWPARNVFGPNAGQPNERTTQIDPESLDRLHRWVAAFKKHGIYTNANLLVSRTFRAADGLPESIEDVEWKIQGAIAMWHPAMIELQKEYARQLLAPNNPHTGVPLASDNSLATVEINNENGILHAWLSGQIDTVPADLAEPLRVMWNDWLREKYVTQEGLAEAWEPRHVPIDGSTPLIDGDASAFQLQTHGGAEASVGPAEGAGGRAATVRVQKGGTDSWHVQYGHPGLRLNAGEPYTLRFTARADSPRTISVDARQAHEPWNNLGLSRHIELGPEFKQFEFTFVPTASDDNARITFDSLSQTGAEFTFETPYLYHAGTIGLPEKASLDDGSIPLPAQDGLPMTLPQRRDWFAFCMDAERAYFGEMRRFLKEDLGVVAPIVGTVVGCSPMGVQKEMDAIDTHAYWRHPEFPGESWSPDNWIVRPDSMVDHPESAAILGPMLRQVRVDGRRLPHMLTEYDHPAPNPHAGEGPLFLAAYAALQDFDAIYLFAYDVDFDAEPGKINGFFDTASHPTVMANCLPAALMFRRGDIEPAEQEAIVGITEEMELDALVERGAAWSMVDYGTFTGRPLDAYRQRVAVNFTDAPTTADALPPRGPFPHFFETGGMLWVANEGKGDWTVADSELLAAVGSREAHLSPMRLNAPSLVRINSPTAQTMALVPVSSVPFSTVQWVPVSPGAKRGSGAYSHVQAKGPKRALLVATGQYANTDWQWKTDAHLSLGTNWGTAPTLIEVVPVTLTLKADKSAKAWALDAVGKRVEEVDVELNDGTATIRVGPGHTETATLFYEIEWE